MMFYDLTAKKSLPLLGIIAALAIVLGTFAYANSSAQIVSRALDFFGRAQSGFLFALFYSPPWAQSAAVAAAPEGEARAVPVLIYHGTPPEGNDNPPLPQNVFVEQMRALKADGWQTITMQQFTDFMKNGKPLPAKSFLLTFDDARKESFYPVDPVLQELGYNAVMFTITGFSLPDPAPRGGSYYLSRTELEYMALSGRWELESHGDLDHKLYDVPTSTSDGPVETVKEQHFLTNKFWLEGPGRVETTAEYTARIQNDLETSKQKLDEIPGTDVTAFAFPFNDYGQEGGNFAGARDILADQVKSLFTFSFYQVNPSASDPFNYPDPDAYMIKRIEPTADWSGQDMVERLDAGLPKTLPYSATTFPAGEWSGNWGSVSPENNTLVLASSPATSGAVALLNGSAWWQDYSISANVDWQSGDALSLVARYHSDSAPFLTCAFTDGKILLQTHEGGAVANAAAKDYRPGDLTAMQISMQVSGDQVSCSAGGVSVEAKVGSQFAHPGEAGVEIWGKDIGREKAVVHAISVSGA